MGTAAFRWTPRIGAAAGAALAVALLAAGRMPEHDGRLGLDLTVAAIPTGELAVRSAGPIVTGTGMEPGSGRVGGVAEVRNQTGRRLAFRVRALPSIRELDDALGIRVAGGEQVLYEGELSGLRRWATRALVLGPRETRTLSVAAWLRPGTAAVSAGRSLDVPLELRRGS